MLVAALTLVENFESEKATFVAESPVWDGPYAENFKAVIELLLTEVYGINQKSELRAITSQVNQLVEGSMEDLRVVKSQIDRGFRLDPSQRDSLLELLGYRGQWKAAVKPTQEAVISLLLSFRNNMDADMRTGMEEKGVSPARIDKILTAGDELNHLNVTQESLKGTTRLEVAQVNARLNAIYDQAMDIGVLGQKLFRKDRLKKDLFVFTKLIKAQSASANSGAPAAEGATV
jgi:hypothetical protein